jgi:hypothetical protein
MNKNDYYHIFKTQLENHLGTRSESQVRRVNSSWTNFFLIMTTSFWPKKSSGFFTRVDSDFFTGSNKVIPSSIFFRERLEMRANPRFQKNQFFVCFGSFWCADLKNNFLKMKKTLFWCISAWKNTLKSNRNHTPKQVLS